MLKAPQVPSRSARSRRCRAPAFAAVLAAAAWVALPLPFEAQSVVVDQGTFLLSRNGRAVGTESFTIRRTGRGPEARLILTGETRMEVDGPERRITSALEVTGPDLRVTAYQVKEADGDPSEVYMTLNGRRFQATVRSPAGEQLREFRASAGAVVLDGGMAHHYFLLVARTSDAATAVPAIVPRTGERLELRIRDEGSERVTIAGQMVQARRLVVENGEETREIWVDEESRILRVVNHATGLRAERRNLPS